MSWGEKPSFCAMACTCALPRTLESWLAEIGKVLPAADPRRDDAAEPALVECADEVLEAALLLDERADFIDDIRVTALSGGREGSQDLVGDRIEQAHEMLPNCDAEKMPAKPSYALITREVCPSSSMSFSCVKPP